MAELRERIAAVRNRLSDLAFYVQTKPCYWIDGDDQGEEFCRRCGLREIRVRRAAGKRGLSLGGGYGTDHDSPPYCTTCGVALEGSLTDYGVSAEIEHFLSDFNELWPADAYALDLALDAFYPATKDTKLVEEVLQVCARVEELLDRGAVAMPEPRQQRCHADRRALAARRRRCRRTRQAKTGCCGRFRRTAAGTPTPPERLSICGFYEVTWPAPITPEQQAKMGGLMTVATDTNTSADDLAWLVVSAAPPAVVQAAAMRNPSMREDMLWGAIEDGNADAWANPMTPILCLTHAGDRRILRGCTAFAACAINAWIGRGNSRDLVAMARSELQSLAIRLESIGQTTPLFFIFARGYGDDVADSIFHAASSSNDTDPVATARSLLALGRRLGAFGSEALPTPYTECLPLVQALLEHG